MIWRLRWGERWLYVYLLLEFQSSVDRFMAVRLLTYVGLLYQDLVATKEIPKVVICRLWCRSCSTLASKVGGRRRHLTP